MYMQRQSGKALVAGLAIVTVGIGAFAAGQGRPVITKPNETIRSLTDPITLLRERVDELEKKVTTLEKENATLKAAVAPVPGAVEKSNFLYSEFQKPGGIQGVNRKIYQKNGWNRIPNDAYIITYHR